MQSLPPIRQQFIQSVVRPASGEPVQHVGQVRQRWDMVLYTRAHYAVKSCGTTCRLVGACEQVVLASQRDVTQLLLADVVIRRKTSVVEEARQRCPLSQAVACGLCEVAAGRFSFRSEEQPPFQLLERVSRSFAA